MMASVPRPAVLLLGVDGGGTTTEAWLAEPGGKLIGRGTAGPSNAKAVGLQAARQALDSAIQAAFQRWRARRRRLSISPALAWLDSIGPTIADCSLDGPMRLVGPAGLSWPMTVTSSSPPARPRAGASASLRAPAQLRLGAPWRDAPHGPAVGDT